MSKLSSKKFKWNLEFNTKSNKNSDYASPPGYNLSAGQHHSEVARDTDQSQLIIKKSWDVALGPVKGIPMNLLIMYMAGNSISIFPIMMVGMSLIRPLKAIFTTSQTFKSFEINQNIALQKFIFFIGNLINIGLALYKCHSMGLLPTHASDWLAFVDPQQRIEFSDGGISLI
ncbi:CLUMA_CG003989, isoform A [Clunio marinus]|uniref:ER membrane protein complex subunit 4 n=1 Tax=Clunio marinus TaxID=568069 RepID=A0A1J1HQP9_9DIPT|nr:CLUMA_CG003989, isoform A [Clunio marinus]